MKKTIGILHAVAGVILIAIGVLTILSSGERRRRSW